jgi:effector-binding domain-containing protein
MIGQPSIETRAAQHYMGIHTTVSFKGMFAAFDQCLKELRTWVKQNGLEDEGPFLLRYHVIDMSGSMQIEAGYGVSKHRPAIDRIKPGVLPAGRYATLTYSGSGLQGNKALIEWANQNGIAWDRHDDPAGDAFACRFEAFQTQVRLVPRKTQNVLLAIKIAELEPPTAWPKIGAPALRALKNAGYTRLEQLANVSEAELLSLHGMGPKAVRILREGLEGRDPSFAAKEF